MNGMHRISGPGAMPANCGMQGMHGNISTAQSQKVDTVADTLQRARVTKFSGDVKVSNDTTENIIDVKI